MSLSVPSRGGNPIGYVTDLGEVEAGAVRYLRLWCSGPGPQAEVLDDFIGCLGPTEGRSALDSLEGICRLCALHGRRPLVRHQPACRHLGTDEACFANFIAAAGEGAREDAMLIATLIVRADMACVAVEMAERLGLALRRMGLRRRRRLN